jgi:hypothetical protein
MVGFSLHNVISQAWPLKTVNLSSGCPKTSINNYQLTLCYNPEEWGTHTAAEAWNLVESVCGNFKSRSQRWITFRRSEGAEVITIVSLGCYESWMCELVQCTGNYSSPARPHVNRQWVEGPTLPPRVKHLLAAVSLRLGIELRTKNNFIYDTPCVCFVFRDLVQLTMMLSNMTCAVALKGCELYPGFCSPRRLQPTTIELSVRC